MVDVTAAHLRVPDLSSLTDVAITYMHHYLSLLVKHTLSMREVWDSIPGPVKLGQCRHVTASPPL